ncbi:MAG TPA: phosphotransferase [Thermoanaerobaculia bacterium]|nr:phosphotransferase [Thermoanaerobaculia bacterium]
MTVLPEEAASFLRESVGAAWSVEPLAGDASVRRYFRVRLPDGSTRMLAYYPPEVRPQLEQFLEAHRAVEGHGRVPDVLEHSACAVLQVDVGDRTLYDLLHDDRAEGVRLYRKAIDALVEFQAAGNGGVNPPFSAAFFLGELEMTRTFFVERLMGGEGGELLPFFRRLCENLTRHQYVLCHRDYHGQNIHISNGSLYIIDYQDMRMGPDSYDLASLLRDRGVARMLGEETESEFIAYYASRRGADDGLRARYFETLLQRSLKILGTFSRQPIERGRLHYLEFIPPTIESVERCLRELPEFAALRAALPLDFSVERARERVKGMAHGQA